MTAAEMLGRMSSVELSWWAALYRVEGEEQRAQAEAAAREAAHPPDP